MPNPYDLYLQSLERSRRQPPAAPSLMQTVGSDPIGFAKGLGLGIAAIPKGIFQLGKDVIGKTASEGPIEGVAELLGGLGGRAFNEKLKQESLIRGKPQNLEDELINITSAAGKFILEDLLPGRQIKELATGKKTTGFTNLGDPIERNITSEELGENITLGAIQLIPFSKFLSRGSKFRTSGLSDEAVALATRRKSPTIGEITANRSDEIATTISKQTKPPPPTATTQVLEKQPLERLRADYHDNYRISGRLDTGDIDIVVKDLLRDEVMLETALRMDPNTRVSAVARQAILDGSLSDNVVDFLKSKYDLPDAALDLISDDISKALLAAETAAGESLGIMANAASTLHGKTVLAAQRGNTLARERLILQDRLKQRVRDNNGTLSLYDFSNEFSKSIESLRHSVITASPVTAMRNALNVVGPVNLSSLLEGATTDVINTVSRGLYNLTHTDKIPKNANGTFHELGSQLHTIASAFSKEERVLAHKLLDSLPLTKERIFSTRQLDVNTTTFAEIAGKKYGPPVANFLDDFKHTISYFNRTQEVYLRRLLFMDRLEANLKSLDWADNIQTKNGVFHRLYQELQKPELPSELRNVIADAESFAMKSTFSSNPVSGLGKAMMNVYKVIPFSTALLPTFPRFLYNSWAYLTERSPTNIAALWNKDFRATLSAGAKDGFARQAAARHLAKGFEGLALLGGAYMVRTNPEWGGSKYYHVKENFFPNMDFIDGPKPPKDENNQIDLRAYQPFATYLFMADMLKTVNENREINLTPNELADALFGIRRIAEVPAFNISDTLRSIKSSNPETVRTAINTPIGQYLASFFVPFHSVREWVGAFSKDNEALVRRDVDTQELTGPMRESIAFESLPKRMDVFTGQPVQTRRSDALIRQLTGFSRSNILPLQELVLQTPDFSPNDIAGNYGNPQANNLVVQNIGRILSTDTGGEPLGTRIATYIKTQNLTPQAQKEALQEVFREVRDLALEDATKQNPQAFIDYAVANEVTPSQRRPTMRFIESVLTQQGAFR